MNRLSKWVFLSGKDFNLLRAYQFYGHTTRTEFSIKTEKSENLNGLCNDDMKENAGRKVFFLNLKSESQPVKKLNPRIFKTQAEHKRKNGNQIKESVKVLKIFSANRNRDLGSLNEVSYKICSYPDFIDLKDCSTILYSMATLSFKDKNLLDKVAESIITRQSDIYPTGKLPASLLHSIGVLQYRNCELIEVLIKKIMESRDENSIEHLLKGVVTLAILNMSTSYNTELLNELSKCSEKDFDSTKSHINFVWASVLLNYYPVEHISTVLSERFIRIVNNLNGLHLKLVNINSAATKLLKSYDGPKMNKIQCKLNAGNRNEKDQFLHSVLDTLQHMFSKKIYLNTNIDTGAGFFLDIEYVVNKTNNPIFQNIKEGTKIGFMLLNFNDFCLDDKNTFTGLTEFKVRILEAMGYKVIIIPSTEFLRNMKLLMKIQYIEKKIDDARCKD